MKENEQTWYVIMSKPNQELKAIENLKNQNFDVFSPYFEKESNSGKFSRIVKEFLFPSYIFVKFNIENLKWLKIRYTIGVKKILSVGSCPSKIEKKFVEGLKGFSDEKGLLIGNFFTFKPKQKIMIAKGPFKKIFGEVISLIGNKRVKVLLNCVDDYKTLVLEKKNILPN